MGALSDHLKAVGLNQLEAEVYIDLWQHGAATGYAVGKRIGKQTANVYKAVESLQAKGAVLVEEGGRNRQCRAVAPEQFLTQLERSFQNKKAAALASLRELPAADSDDEKVYRLDSAELVIERAIDMLNRCQSIAILDAFPNPLSALSTALEQAAARGVQVIVQAYRPITLANVQVTLTYQAQFNLTFWQSQQLNLVIDGAESLLALLNHDLTAVHQAVWNQSSYLSFIMHVGLLRENNAHQIFALDPDEVNHADIQRILALDARFHPDSVPGLKNLLLRHGVEAQ